MIEFGVFLLDFAIAENLCVHLREVVAYKHRLPFVNNNPVGSFDSGSIAGTAFLCLHLLVEFLLVHCHFVLFEDELSEVERESVGVVHYKCVFTADFGFACRFCVGYCLFKKFHTCFKGAEECFLFLFDNLLD